MAGTALAAIPAVTSIAGSLFGGKKSTANNVQLPAMFQMPNLGPAANNAFTGIQNLPGTGVGAQFIPQLTAATQNLVDNPYAPQAQGAANTGGQMVQQGASNAFQGGGALADQGMSLLPYATAIGNTAFDPQQALYQRTLQQLQDQTRASEAARGIVMSPYGAGVENKALSDFNIDWQNAQLGRQAQGASAIENLLQGAGGAIGAGTGLQTAGGQSFAAGGALPYNTAETIGRGQQSDIASLFGGTSAGQQTAQLPIQDYLNYLGIGNQATGVANQTGQLGLNQNQLAFNQNAQMGQNLGAGLAALGSQNNMSWLNSIGSWFA